MNNEEIKEEKVETEVQDGFKMKKYEKGDIYREVKRFKKRHRGTIAWRIKKHCKIVEKYIDHNEIVKYAFAAQKSEKTSEIFYTNVIVLTNKRLIVAKKRVVFGHSCISITPDLYNDLKVKKHIIWGDVIIDTLHEEVYLSHIAPSALDEIETNINAFMNKEKRKYFMSNRK